MMVQIIDREAFRKEAKFHSLGRISSKMESKRAIKKLIMDAIAETNATGPAGMGLVMKVLQPKIAGKADGGLVSSLVKAALSQ